MTDRPQDQEWLFWLAFGLSLAVHVGLAAHLLSRAAPDFGAIDRATKAISVNIEATDVLDASEQSAAKDAAPASVSPPEEAASVPETEPEKTGAPQRNAQETPAAETGPPPAAATEAAAKRLEEDALRQAAEAEREARQAEQRARDRARQIAQERDRARHEAKARDAEAERRAENAKRTERRARDGRAQASGSTGAKGAKSAAGRVSASRGDLQNYRGIVNAWVARHKPSAPDGRGNVVLIVALSTSGDVISASVSSSSGDHRLDGIALEAIRRRVAISGTARGIDRQPAPFQDSLSISVTLNNGNRT